MQIRCARAISVLAVIATLSGCLGGDGGQSSNTPAPAPASVAMVAGQEYQVFQSDRVVTTSSTPAQLRIRHEPSDNARFVTLVSGSADLFR